MASLTKIYMTRVALKIKKMGRKRKNQLNTRGTTPSKAVFFGEQKPSQATATTQA